ncbi:MAG: PhoH family protein [Planctomycetota bacterium]|nr:MAG: PhoH family protein [Planctomycetota bacterium]
MERSIPFGGREELTKLFGTYDRNPKENKKATGGDVTVRNGDLHIRGTRAAVDKAVAAFVRLKEINAPTPEDVHSLFESVKPHRGGGDKAAVPGNIFRAAVQVDAKSEGQSKYLQDIDQNDIVFAIGPAGTGKTFLAVSKAVEALKAGRIRRIVLVRPAVEAGERLGFLPGDIQAKVNPYLRPIYDSLNTFLEFGQLQRMITADVVEICPLAYMRGRTLDEAFIILDEAQNTTSEQMKMFLTRMGRSSKIVVTGDITQIDLTPGKPSGLVEVKELLKGVSGIAFAYLSKADIVRHPLVQKIVDAYEHQRRR